MKEQSIEVLEDWSNTVFMFYMTLKIWVPGSSLSFTLSRNSPGWAAHMLSVLCVACGPITGLLKFSQTRETEEARKFVLLDSDCLIGLTVLSHISVTQYFSHAAVLPSCWSSYLQCLKAQCQMQMKRCAGITQSPPVIPYINL